VTDLGHLLLAFQALAEAITLTGELDDAAMRQAIQERANVEGIVRDLAPVSEGQIARHQVRPLEVTPADKGEEHICPLLGERDEANFVDVDQVLLHEQRPRSTLAILSINRIVYKRKIFL
jgi:hypothetical protein